MYTYFVIIDGLYYPVNTQAERDYAKVVLSESDTQDSAEIWQSPYTFGYIQVNGDPDAIQSGRLIWRL